MHSLPFSPAEKLQQLPSRYHWVYADSLLLYSIAQEKSVQRGAAGMRLARLVKLFNSIRLVYLLLFMVGAYELAKLLLQQLSTIRPRLRYPLAATGQQYPAYFFVGFGAGSEQQLFAEYSTAKASSIARINQTSVESMMQWHRVDFLKAIAALIDSLRTVRQALRVLPEELLPWKADFLTFAGMRLGYFTFIRVWFKQLKANAPYLNEVCFLAADTAAFAAIDADLPTRYLQHGLIRHSLVLPNFDHVDALTHDERIHFRQRIPTADTQLTRPVRPLVLRRQPPCILIASVYLGIEEMRRILPLLEFVSQFGFVIYVRPHPREGGDFWQTADLPFDVAIEGNDATFDEALDRLRPNLVVSWFSTALVDALYRGVITVSVSAREDHHIQDMVYPLFRHCLHWPSDQALLEKVLSDPIAYEATLRQLNSFK